MTNRRPPSHPWGMNPRQYNTTGTVTYATRLNGPCITALEVGGRQISGHGWMEFACLRSLLKMRLRVRLPSSPSRIMRQLRFETEAGHLVWAHGRHVTRSRIE